MGYWGQACGDSGSELSPARRAVDAMTARVRAGVPVAELAAAAVAEGVELAYGLGGAIGLGLDDAPRVRAGGDETLAEGAVVALQAFAVADGALTCAGETVVVGDERVTTPPASPASSRIAAPGRARTTKEVRARLGRP